MEKSPDNLEQAILRAKIERVRERVDKILAEEDLILSAQPRITDIGFICVPVYRSKPTQGNG